VYQGRTTRSEQYLQRKQNRKSDTNRKKLLVYAQHGERTKPPTMKIEGKSSPQPHIEDRLNPINHLMNRAFFAFE